jgi:hypothetical protein
MRIFFVLLLSILNIIKNTDIQVDMLAVPNECSSLGGNNPLQTKDCQIYKFTKKYCCMLTITFKDKDDEVRTSCIILDSISNDAKSKRRNEYNKTFTNVDILIECHGKNIARNLFFFILLIVLLF